MYRLHEKTGIGFGAGHVMDVLRGKDTDKVRQFGHQAISTWGLAAESSETELRSVLRQLVALGALQVDSAHFNTLRLTAAARPILRGEQTLQLRHVLATPRKRGQRDGSGRSRPSATAHLDGAGQERFDALKAWRSEVARTNGVPAYVIFHDSVLAAIDAEAPTTLTALRGTSGVGEAKLARYGEELLRVLETTE